MSQLRAYAARFGALAGAMSVLVLTPAHASSRTVVRVVVSVEGGGLVHLAGMSCAPRRPCRVEVARGRLITLLAIPSRSSNFSGWGGACGSEARCSFTLTRSRFVTAHFTRDLTPPGPVTVSGGIADHENGFVYGIDSAHAGQFPSVRISTERGRLSSARWPRIHRHHSRKTRTSEPAQDRTSICGVRWTGSHPAATSRRLAHGKRLGGLVCGRLIGPVTSARSEHLTGAPISPIRHRSR